MRCVLYDPALIAKSESSANQAIQSTSVRLRLERNRLIGTIQESKIYRLGRAVYPAELCRFN